MDAYPKHDLLFLGDAGVAIDHRCLHLDRRAHRIDCAAKLDDDAVACALYEAALVLTRSSGRSTRAEAP